MTAFPEERFPTPGGPSGPALFRDRAFVDRPLTMRGVTEEDLPELVRVDGEAFPDEPYPYFVLRQLFDLHGDCLLVLDDGQRLHGYVLYVTTGDGYRSWIVSLGVTRDQRGRSWPAADAGGAAPVARRRGARGAADGGAGERRRDHAVPVVGLLVGRGGAQGLLRGG